MVNRLSDKYKTTVFQVFLLASVVASLIFAFINFYRNHLVLAGLELLVFLFSSLLLAYVYFNKNQANIKFLSFIYVLLFFSLLMFALSSKNSSANVFLWAFVIPMVSYLLLGVKLGFIMTAVFYLMSAWLFYLRFGSQLSMSGTISYANIFFSATLLWILSHVYELTTQKANNKLRKMAVLDHLTGLYNRTLLQRIYDETSKRSLEKGNKFGLVLFDLDHFKIINDEFGHATGDQVLIEFSEIVSSVYKNKGTVFRIGGEEFVVLLSIPQESDEIELAELVRKKTARLMLPQVNNRQITVSVGIAMIDDQNTVIDEAIKLADKRMYNAKHMGRNSVVSVDQA